VTSDQLLFTAEHGARQRVDTILSGGWVITVDPQRRMYRHGAVAIAGSVIIAVGDAASIGARFQANQNIDTSEKVMMPGLINGHRHLLATPNARESAGFRLSGVRVVDRR